MVLRSPIEFQFASRLTQTVDIPLTSKAPKETVNRLLGWSELPNKDFPLMFLGVNGVDKRESDSPSFFNPYGFLSVAMGCFSLAHIGRIEASAVAHLIRKVVLEKKLLQSDVGVITPYYKQVLWFSRSSLSGRVLTCIKLA